MHLYKCTSCKLHPKNYKTSCPLPGDRVPVSVAGHSLPSLLAFACVTM